MKSNDPASANRQGTPADFDPLSSLPALNSKTEYQMEYRELLAKYPFRKEYIGRIDPFSKKKILNEEDYNQFIREYVYASVCEKCTDESMEGQEADPSAAKHEESPGYLIPAQPTSVRKEPARTTTFSGSKETVKASPSRSSRKIICMTAVFLAAIAAVGMIALPKLRKSSYEAGYAAGRSAAETTYRQGVVETSPTTDSTAGGKAPGYQEGYEAGYQEGNNAGYQEGVEQGYANGVQEAGEHYAKLNTTSTEETEPVLTTQTSISPSERTASSTTEEPVAVTYIGNKNSKKFHLPTCSTLPAEQNRILFQSREEAIDAGFEPCKRCNP